MQAEKNADSYWVMRVRRQGALGRDVHVDRATLPSFTLSVSSPLGFTMAHRDKPDADKINEYIEKYVTVVPNYLKFLFGF